MSRVRGALFSTIVIVLVARYGIFRVDGVPFITQHWPGGFDSCSDVFIDLAPLVAAVQEKAVSQ